MYLKAKIRKVKGMLVTFILKPKIFTFFLDILNFDQNFKDKKRGKEPNIVNLKKRYFFQDF